MRHPNKMEELLPQDFEAEKKLYPVIYLPFAPVEYHGCHVTLNSDTAKGYEMCLRAAKITGGLVYPLLPIAPIGHPPMERDGIHDFMRNNNYPGVFISASLCRRLLFEMLDVFAEDLNFKVCVMCGSHGPAETLAKEICQEFKNIYKGMKITACGSLSHSKDIIQAEYEKLGIPRIRHGGCWETAMLYACRDDFFCPEIVNKTWPESFKDIPNEHFDGNTEITRAELRQVTTGFGNKIMDISAKRIAAEVIELLRDCK